MKVKINFLVILLAAATVALVLWMGKNLSAGTVTQVSGRCIMNGEPLTAGTRIRAGDLVEMAPGATAAVRFPFRAAMKLSEAKIAFKSTVKELAFDLHSGGVMSSVRSGVKFKVKTPLAAASVRGTNFYVNASSETYVCACSGTVAVDAGMLGRELTGGAQHSAGVVRAGAAQIEPDVLRLHTDEDGMYVAALLKAR